MTGINSGIIRFKRSFPFRAGQVIKISVSRDLPPRLYSIASSETDDFIEILYKEIPSGALTPEFKTLSAGDRLLISFPFGSFLASHEPAYFLATGTGIAPFLSMIRSGNSYHKKLVHGSREITEFYFSDELKQILKENYICCYTGGERSSHFKGRITAYLTQQENLPTKIKYYLCGSAEMVVDTRQVLINKGIPFQNILSEIYF